MGAAASMGGYAVSSLSAISNAFYMGLTYCCCQSLSGVCGACLGAESGTTGRKRSVLLLAFTVTLSLLFQYYVAPHILNHTGWWNVYRKAPGTGKLIYNSWTDGCERFEHEEDPAAWEQCAGNNGVYRPTFVSAVFFLISALAVKMRPAINREAWLAKYGLFFMCVLGTVFIPNTPLFSGIFLILARLGAMIFVVLQQIILIDVAYNWNEDWVERSNTCDRIEYGSGNKWLRAIIATCVIMYSASLAFIIVMYKQFLGCPENTWVITLTLIGILALTAIQLSGTEGSLLTSSVISLYVTYLAFSIVSKNPNSECNPNLGSNDVAGIVIGLTLTAISLAWTGWSWSAENRLNAEGIQATKSVSPNQPPAQNPDTLNLDVPFLDPEDQPTTGIVTEDDHITNSYNGTALWKINVVMALISCWIAVSLTGWGTVEMVSNDGTEEGAHTAANPMVGRVNMAMIGVSQWVAILLYGWTLLAPRVFPDRDFS